MTTDPSALPISARVSIPLQEIELTAVRAAGPGGQHVNKVASAIHLRFDIRASSLPDAYKERLLALSASDQRVTQEGVVVLKAQEYRSQPMNREAALARLQALVRSVTAVNKKRVPTKPTRAARQRRLEGKKKRAQLKDLRRKPPQ